MKTVENPGSFLYRPDIKQAPGAPARKKSGGMTFMSLFRNDQDESLVDNKNESPDLLADTKKLEQQVDLIHELGQKLVKKQTLEQVQEYKTAIKALLQVFLKQGVKAEELVSSRNILNQKKYTIVRVIDEKLEKLITGILQSQVQQMDILSRLEEIQGLLVDLVH